MLVKKESFGVRSTLDEYGGWRVRVKVVWVIVGEGTRMRRKYPGVWNGVGARGGGGAKGNEDECETSGSPLKIEKANRR